MRQPSKPKRYFAKTVALAIACCLLVFLIQIVVHDHENGQNEAACRVCHAAHIGVAPAINAFLLAAPLLPSGSVREIALRFHKDLFGHDSPSRAPPAA